MSNPICEESQLVQGGRNLTALTIDGTRQFTEGFFIFGMILNAFCLTVWVKEKRKYERTQVRPTMLVVLSVLCSVAEMCCGPLNIIIPTAYPCWLAVILINMTIPF